jgi:hypothetical protein
MRLYIWITPHRILWWNHSDFSSKPNELVAVNGVE